MGAVHFSLDPRLARLLQGTLALEVFVETGTAEGDTVAGVRPFFSEIHTIESDHQLHAAAARRFVDDASVRVHFGDSPLVLARIVPDLASRSVLYWLDAHATGSRPGEGPECPLLEELAAISVLNARSVIAIDDARLFLAPPPPPRRPDSWPDLPTILARLNSLSPGRETMVIDDVLVFAPASARGPLRDFAHHQGFDWLQAADKARAYDALLRDARAKEGVLREQQEALRAREELLRRQDAEAGEKDALLTRQDAEAREKDALIQRLDRECRVRDERLAALEAELAARMTPPLAAFRELLRRLRRRRP